MLDLAYVAGVFDGEGWVRIDTYVPPGRTIPRYQLIAGIAMTYAPLMKAVHAQFGGTLHGDDSFQRHYAKNRVIWRWHVSSKFAHSFLIAVEPYLIVKKEQAGLGIELQADMTGNKRLMIGHGADPVHKEIVYARRHDIALRMSALKKVDYPVNGDDPTSAA